MKRRWLPTPARSCRNCWNWSCLQTSTTCPGCCCNASKPRAKKNVYGSYYTPRPLAESLLAGVDFSRGQTLFEPGCGSAAILCAATAQDPQQLFGVDIDPLAVLAARTNLLLKFPEREFVPQIFELDFLNGRSPGTPPGGFDCVAANPPWGAAGRRGESFAAFMFRSFALLKEGGELRFLLPESVLDVARHWRLRDFMLNSAALDKNIGLPRQLRRRHLAFCERKSGQSATACRL